MQRRCDGIKQGSKTENINRFFCCASTQNPPPPPLLSADREGWWVGVGLDAKQRVYRSATKTPVKHQTKEACRARNAGSPSKKPLGITVAINYAEGPIVGSSPPFFFQMAERFKE